MLEPSPKAPTQWNWKSALILSTLIIAINFAFLSFIQLYLLILTGWQFNESGVIIAAGSLLGVWIGAIISELIILGLTLYIAIYIFKGKLTYFNFKLPNLKNFLIAIGGAAAAWGAAFLSSFLQDWILPDPHPESYTLLFKASNIYELLIWIVLMMIIVAPCEEIFARGFVQQGLQNSCKNSNKSIYIGILAASLLFAVTHLDPYRIIPLFCVGFVLGLVYYYTGNNTMASAITHGLYNVIGLLLFFFF